MRNKAQFAMTKSYFKREAKILTLFFVAPLVLGLLVALVTPFFFRLAAHRHVPADLEAPERRLPVAPLN